MAMRHTVNMRLVVGLNSSAKIVKKFIWQVNANEMIAAFLFSKIRKIPLLCLRIVRKKSTLISTTLKQPSSCRHCHTKPSEMPIPLLTTTVTTR